jgi:predicted PurR-regulated permease PerM
MHVVAAGIKAIFSFISPVIIGAVLAYLMNPMVCFLERKIGKKVKKPGSSHTLAVVLTVLFAVLIIVLIIVAVVPSVVSNILTLAANADNYMRMIDRFFTKIGSASLSLESLMDSMEDTVDKVMEILPNSFNTIVRTSVSVGSTVANALIGFVIAIYFLLDKTRVLNAIDRLIAAILPYDLYQKTTRFFKRVDHVFIQYITYNLIDGLIIGVANAIFMLLFRMPYVALLSVLVGVTNLLPTVGPLIGGAIGAFILVINKPIMALWFLIFTAVIQTLDAYVIKPKLFGNALGIPAVLTLISIVLGGKLYGIIGILLAIPVVSVICDLYHNDFLPFLERKRKAERKEGLITADDSGDKSADS